MSDPLYGNDRTCWSSKTAEDIIADMRAAVEKILELVPEPHPMDNPEYWIEHLRKRGHAVPVTMPLPFIDGI